ncbi:hypothetical protein TNCV_295761 [Trichonephila clavipes]|nr:hypothetical protein TNCV_295761 [Trichonephila clavipes]
MLSNATSGPSFHPIRYLSSSSFHKALLYNNLGQVSGSSIVTTEFSQTATSFLAELNPIPTLKTTYGNCGRHKNVANELNIADALASTQKRVASEGRREGAVANCRATSSASKHNAYCI